MVTVVKIRKKPIKIGNSLGFIVGVQLDKEKEYDVTVKEAQA